MTFHAGFPLFGPYSSPENENPWLFLLPFVLFVFLDCFGAGLVSGCLPWLKYNNLILSLKTMTGLIHSCEQFHADIFTISSISRWSNSDGQWARQVMHILNYVFYTYKIIRVAYSNLTSMAAPLLQPELLHFVQCDFLHIIPSFSLMKFVSLENSDEISTINCLIAAINATLKTIQWCDIIWSKLAWSPLKQQFTHI